MRILLIEDDPRLGPLVSRALTGDGHRVTLIADGVDALAAASAGGWETIVLDRRLPRLDGLVLLRALRSGGDRTPVLLLTALAEVTDRVEGLDAGAEDYLTKPFEIAELLARVRALARRAEPGPGGGSLRVGRLVLDETRHVARAGDAEAELTAREFALLAFLMRHHDETLDRARILAAVWGSATDAYSNVVDLYISYVRRKLEALGLDGMIQTVHGRGYRLGTGG